MPALQAERVQLEVHGEVPAAKARASHAQTVRTIRHGGDIMCRRGLHAQVLRRKQQEFSVTV